MHDPLAWRGQVLCSEPERAALARIVEWGLVDCFRAKYPELQAFTWWDYRMLGFQKGRGLRIDHILLTPPLYARLEDVSIDREERKGKGASDVAALLIHGSADARFAYRHERYASESADPMFTPSGDRRRTTNDSRKS